MGPSLFSDGNGLFYCYFYHQQTKLANAIAFIDVNGQLHKPAPPTSYVDICAFLRVVYFIGLTTEPLATFPYPCHWIIVQTTALPIAKMLTKIAMMAVLLRDPRRLIMAMTNPVSATTTATVLKFTTSSYGQRFRS